MSTSENWPSRARRGGGSVQDNLRQVLHRRVEAQESGIKSRAATLLSNTRDFILGNAQLVCDYSGRIWNCHARTLFLSARALAPTTGGAA